MTVAVFDDDAAFVPFLCDVLTGAGYHVVVSTTADDALAVIQREPPVLAILDFWIGGGTTGLAVLRAIREDAGTVTLPVLICSADHHALHAFAGDWQALGCATLVKPCSRDDLLHRVTRLVTRVEVK